MLLLLNIWSIISSSSTSNILMILEYFRIMYLCLRCVMFVIRILHNLSWYFWYLYCDLLVNSFSALYRSSRWRRSIRKVVPRNFAKFTWKHLCQSLFFNKFAGLRPSTLLKKRLWYRCFLVNFAKFLRTPFLQNIPGRLLLIIKDLGDISVKSIFNYSKIGAKRQPPVFLLVDCTYKSFGNLDRQQCTISPVLWYIPPL